MAEVYLHKRQLTPFERHKRSKDVLSIQSSNLAVLQSPLLDGEYEFGYFANIAADEEELDACCTDIAGKFASEIISGNENCSFLQYGQTSNNGVRCNNVDDEADDDSDDYSDKSEVVVLSQVMREVWNFIQLSSKFIQFEIQCSFAAMDACSKSSAVCVDLLTNQFCGCISSCSKVYAFDLSAIEKVFHRGMLVFQEMVDRGTLQFTSILSFSMYFTQRNINTNFTKYSRYNHTVIMDSENVDYDVLNILHSNLRKNMKKKNCGCVQYKNNDSNLNMFHYKACSKCLLKNMVDLSDRLRIFISVSPSNLSSSLTLRAMQFGQDFSGMVGENTKEQITDRETEHNFDLLRNIQILQEKLLSNGELRMKISEKIKVRKIVEDLITHAERNYTNIADEQADNSILKNTVKAQHEKILELEAKLSQSIYSNNIESDETYVKAALKISLFRERQAVYYLRQFRRFYRRLLKHKAIQGDTNLQTLDDLNGIDKTLLNLGIIQQRDVELDDAPILYESNDSRDLSKVAANDAFLRYERICKAKSLDGSTSTFDLIYENGQGQEQLLNELTVVTKKCTELQIENARLKNLELIEGAPSSLLKKECMTLKSQLDQSKEELNAVVWKLNELNTNNLLLSNQAQHTRELEDVVNKLQGTLKILNSEKRHLELELRQTLNSMTKKIELLSSPCLKITTHQQYEPLTTSTTKFYYPILGSEMPISFTKTSRISDNETSKQVQQSFGCKTNSGVEQHSNDYNTEIETKYQDSLQRLAISRVVEQTIEVTEESNYIPSEHLEASTTIGQSRTGFTVKKGGIYQMSSVLRNEEQNIEISQVELGAMMGFPDKETTESIRNIDIIESIESNNSSDRNSDSNPNKIVRDCEGDKSSDGAISECESQVLNTNQEDILHSESCVKETETESSRTLALSNEGFVSNEKAEARVSLNEEDTVHPINKITNDNKVSINDNEAFSVQHNKQNLDGNVGRTYIIEPNDDSVVKCDSIPNETAIDKKTEKSSKTVLPENNELCVSNMHQLDTVCTTSNCIKESVDVGSYTQRSSNAENAPNDKVEAQALFSNEEDPVQAINEIIHDDKASINDDKKSASIHCDSQHMDENTKNIDFSLQINTKLAPPTVNEIDDIKCSASMNNYDESGNEIHLLKNNNKTIVHAISIKDDGVLLTDSSAIEKSLLSVRSTSHDLEKKRSFNNPTNRNEKASDFSDTCTDSISSPANTDSSIDPIYFKGGKSATSEPRKFAQKFSPAIKSGVTMKKNKRRIIHSKQIPRNLTISS